MSFLAPMFLLAALAVGLPIILHLIRRTTRERTIFSSLMFLMPSPPRITRRSKLEHILLLLLRCAVICLLAFGFARPFIKQAQTNETPAASRRMIVLVDSSASMRRPGLWDQARSRAEVHLRKALPSDEVALFTFDRHTRPVFTFDDWRRAALGERASLAAQRLADLSPGWLATHAGNALITAAESLADPSGENLTSRTQIILISDLQEGSRLNELQGYEWPKGVEVSIESVKPRSQGNAALHLVTDIDETIGQKNAGFRVRVSNAPDSKQEQFKVGWATSNQVAFSIPPSELYVPAGQSRTITLQAPTGVAADRIILTGDGEEFDNTHFVSALDRLRIQVSYFGTDSGTDNRQPLFFLQRALQENQRQAIQLVTNAPEAAIGAADLKKATVFVVAGSLPAGLARGLHESVAEDKTLLFVIRDENAAATLGALLGGATPALTEGKPSGYAMLGEIDFRHPLFAPFSEPRFSDFTKIHFWKYRRVDLDTIPSARVIARFDNNDPALFEVPVGKGRIIVLTSGWHPEDSQLALSTKFVPLLYALLEQTGAAAPSVPQYHIGDSIALATGGEPRPSSGGRIVALPGGSRLTLGLDQTNFSATTEPGIYTLLSEPVNKRFAVNLDPAESRLTPLALDEFEKLGTPLDQPVIAIREGQRKIRLQNTDLENKQKIWRWLILAALGVLLVETWLAGRTARRLATPGGASPA